MKKIRIVLFGTGAISKFLTQHVKKDVEIVAYLLNEGGGMINGKPIVSLNQLQSLCFDYVVVSFGNTPKGIELLKEVNIPESKIVGYAYTGLTYENSSIKKICDQLIRDKIKNERTEELFQLPPKKYFLCGMNVPETQQIIEKDYVREQTLALLAEEINRKSIDGCVAEVGVSDGSFARKINYLFADRKLYLFDTFDGLPKKDKQKAIGLGWGEMQYALEEKGTPVEQVLDRMPNRDMCIIKKGCFPETFDVQDKFAFISLDVDFYDTVKNSLEKIYPYLSEGGYIMVHDYHNLSYTETKNAVMEFCDENQVAYVPIPDAGGSVVLVK